MSIFGFIKEAIGPVFGLVDELHTSDEEKAKIKLAVQQAEQNFQLKTMEYESRLAEEQAKNIRMEAGGGGLRGNWRPIVMLVFTALIVAHWLGYTAENLSEAQVIALLGIVKLGLGGYLIGRSAEKAVDKWKNGGPK